MELTWNETGNNGGNARPHGISMRIWSVSLVLLVLIMALFSSYVTPADRYEADPNGIVGRVYYNCNQAGVDWGNERIDAIMQDRNDRYITAQLSVPVVNDYPKGITGAAAGGAAGTMIDKIRWLTKFKVAGGVTGAVAGYLIEILIDKADDYLLGQSDLEKVLAKITEDTNARIAATDAIMKSRTYECASLQTAANNGPTGNPKWLWTIQNYSSSSLILYGPRVRAKLVRGDD